MAAYKEKVYDIIWKFRGLCHLHGGTEFAVLYLLPEQPNLYSQAIPEVQDDSETRKHAEQQLLEKLDQLYTDYHNKHGRPAALLLYTWIVPCEECTTAIIRKLESPPFAAIPSRVVAYTTNGEGVPGCSVAASQKMFNEANIELVRCRYYACPFYCSDCHKRNQDYCKNQCDSCRHFSYMH